MSQIGPEPESNAAAISDDHHLSRQLNLRDLVLSQVLTVVGSSWVGLAAGLGHAQTLVWLGSFAVFYAPMAVAVYYLNREMPLEGGLYVWARRAFGDNAIGTFFARLIIFLLQIRILGAASFIFTGVTRLPMTAGWDHLIPEWFARLHPRYRTPTNSVLFSSIFIAMLIVLGSAGAHAAQAFNLLNNASSEFYALAYLAMFAIPIVGAKLLRNRIPLWVAALSAVGFLATLFNFVLNAYPFDTGTQPLPFAIKILVVTLLVNIVGYGFYRLRNKSRLTPNP